MRSNGVLFWGLPPATPNKDKMNPSCQWNGLRREMPGRLRMSTSKSGTPFASRFSQQAPKHAIPLEQKLSSY
ncbi:Hypothetical predicted protein [Podarcis lilfordi]|uniref:Uncharacterized protein n=1 Tax=Podarcis lilfordi TaxID=74358 RepID=A0AA35KVS5_9SAUR|nr:Hypothetical predicted protein [Podarcis lilfordi]